MRTLNELPGELLSQIVSYVQSDRDLWALYLQCRQLRRIVDARYRRRYRRIRLKRNDDPSKAYYILLAFIQQPTLGSYVQELMIDQAHNTYNRTTMLDRLCDAGVSEKDAKSEKLIRRAIKAAGFTGLDEKRMVCSVMQSKGIRPYGRCVCNPCDRSG